MKIFKELEYCDFDWTFKYDYEENLGEYWSNIQGPEQKRWFAEELNLQKNLQIRTLDFKNLNALRTTTRTKKYVENI